MNDGNGPKQKIRGVADIVAIIIAVGFATGFNIFCIAVLWDTVTHEFSFLSENSTQVLTGWGGGMIGILGAYVGYKFGQRAANGPQR